MNTDGTGSHRRGYALAVCAAAAFFALLLLLPPVQGLAVAAGERLKGRPLDHGHWQRALATVSTCIVLFAVCAAAALCYVRSFGSLGELAAAINARGWGTLPVAALFFLLTLLGAGSCITAGHDWGGDFSEYIQQGIAIAEGRFADYTGNGIFIGYPHGYPLLICVMYKLFGFSLLAFKMLNAVFYAVFVFLFFCYCDRRLERATALVIGFLFAFSPCLYDLVDCVLSDTCGLTLAFAALVAIVLFFEETRPRQRWLWSAAVGFLSFLAYIIRDSGLILPCTLAFVQMLRLLRLRRVPAPPRAAGVASIACNILPYIVFILLGYLFNRILFPMPARMDLVALASISPGSILSNCAYYFDRISFFFYPRFIWFALFTAVLWGMLKSLRQDYVFAVYFLGIMAMYVIWPLGGQGIRFIVSALPVIIFFAGRAVELLALPVGSRPLFVFSSRSYVVLALFSCMSFFSLSAVRGVQNLMAGRYVGSGSFTREAVEMYRYMDDSLADSERVFFFKPRVLFMMTGNSPVYFEARPGQAVDSSRFDCYLHTFDHGYGQLLSDEEARQDRVAWGGDEFVCVHENAKFRLFRRASR